MADFDPEAYLREKRKKKGGGVTVGGAFDPEAYLAGKRGSTAGLDAINKEFAPGQAPWAQAPQPDPGAREREATRAKGGVRQFLETAGETAGGPEPGLDAVINDPNVDPIEKQRAANRGLAAYAGMAAGGGAGALFGAGAGAGAGVGTRLATGALAGAAGGEAQAGTEAVLSGKSAGDVAEDVSRGGIAGGLTGGAMAGGSELLAGLSSLVRRFPWVGRYLAAQEAGAYGGRAHPDDPNPAAESPETLEMKNLPGGTQGINDAARKGFGRVMRRDQQIAQDEGAAYGAALNPQGPKPIGRQPVPPAEASAGQAEREALLSAARKVDAPAREAGPARPDQDALLAAARRVDAPGSKAPPTFPPEPAPPAPQGAPWPREGLERPVDRQGMVSYLRAQQRKLINPDTGKVVDPAANAQFEKAIASLGEDGTTNTIGGTLMLRRSLGRQANFGNPNATPEDRAAQTAYQGYRQAVRKASPEVAAADDRYTAYARQAARRRDILFGTENEVAKPGTADAADELVAGEQDPGATADLEAQPELRVAKEKAGVRMMKRAGDQNVPGVENKQFLDELAAQDPEFKNALDFVLNKKAYEGTRFGAPHLPTHLGEAAAHAKGLSIPWIKQNAQALMARGIDPAALAASQGLRLTAPLSGGNTGNAILDAYREAEATNASPTQRRRQQAEFLLNGGR